jgi:predicted ATPase
MGEILVNLDIGKKLNNQQLADKFKCSYMGAMRRSHKTNSLVLILNEEDEIISGDVGKDKSDDTFLFMGMGHEGDQSIQYAQNRTVYYSNKNDINLYLFQKQHKEYEFLGRVLLGEEPKKIKDVEHNRDVISFRLVPIGRNKDIRSFLSQFSIDKLVQLNIISSNRMMLSKDSVNPLLELMKKENIDTLSGPGGWFLSSKRYYYNNNVGSTNQYGKLIREFNNKYVFKEQNAILNPFFMNSINYTLDKNLYNKTIEDQQDIQEKNFKLIKLEVDDLVINFINNKKKYNNEFPFTTLLIGANGTRKSTILSYIQKIFNEMYSFSVGKRKNIDSLSLNFFKLSYEIGEKEYTIIGQGKKRSFFTEGVEIPFDRLTLPNKTIVSTHAVNDRFAYKKDPSILEKSNYEYLGMRTSNTQVNINKLSERVFLNILRSSIENNFLNDLKFLTDFLELDPFIKLNIKMEPEFRNLVMNFNRISEYNFTNGKINYQELVDLHNLISYDSYHHDFISSNHDSLSIIIDLEDYEKYEKQVDIFYSLINFVNKRVLVFDSLMIKKGTFFNIQSASSGENHFFVTITNLLSRIQYSSIILIDEPEISLHPNWQIKYIRALRKIFKKYRTCHFILATHSHFLVSDLTPLDSSIVSLQNNSTSNNLLYDKDTFGWSAENILYNIFQVKTPRNYYIERELTELLGLISSNSENLTKITDIINRISLLPLEDNDPTKEILSQARRYVKNVENK